jgi:hypothetical protein
LPAHPSTTIWAANGSYAIRRTQAISRTTIPVTDFAANSAVRENGINAANRTRTVISGTEVIVIAIKWWSTNALAVTTHIPVRAHVTVAALNLVGQVHTTHSGIAEVISAKITIIAIHINSSVADSFEAVAIHSACVTIVAEKALLCRQNDALSAARFAN